MTSRIEKEFAVKTNASTRTQKTSFTYIYLLEPAFYCSQTQLPLQRLSCIYSNLVSRNPLLYLSDNPLTEYLFLLHPRSRKARQNIA